MMTNGSTLVDPSSMVEFLPMPHDRRMTSSRRLLVTALFAVAAVAFPKEAAAEIIIKDPNPPKYSVEIEPKLNLNYFLFERYGGRAWGPGVRASIPVMSPGFIRSLNNSVAITFGLDMMKYEGTYSYYGWYGFCRRDPGNCPGWGGADVGFWAAHFPVAMQWNFFVESRWSVFGEAGITIRHAFYPDSWCNAATYDPRWGPCQPDATSLYFTFYAGGRFHFTEKLALTMRLGHPTAFSIGLSILL